MNKIIAKNYVAYAVAINKYQQECSFRSRVTEEKTEFDYAGKKENDNFCNVFVLLKNHGHPDLAYEFASTIIFFRTATITHQCTKHW